MEKEAKGFVPLVSMYLEFLVLKRYQFRRTKAGNYVLRYFTCNIPTRKWTILLQLYTNTFNRYGTYMVLWCGESQPPSGTGQEF